MAKITFNVPDAWVAENEYVYGIVEEGITRADAVDRMNKALKEWDYPGQINDHRECGVFWIDPTYLINENTDWKSGISHTRVAGWVEILTLDTEDTTLPGEW